MNTLHYYAVGPNGHWWKRWHTVKRTSIIKMSTLPSSTPSAWPSYQMRTRHGVLTSPALPSIILPSQPNLTVALLKYRIGVPHSFSYSLQLPGYCVSTLWGPNLRILFNSLGSRRPPWVAYQVKKWREKARLALGGLTQSCLQKAVETPRENSFLHRSRIAPKPLHGQQRRDDGFWRTALWLPSNNNR